MWVIHPAAAIGIDDVRVVKVSSFSPCTEVTLERPLRHTDPMDEILDVDLMTFEHGSPSERRAVVDGVMRSLQTGFVYTRSDMSTSVLDDAYDTLHAFFHLPQDRKDSYSSPAARGQAGYTGLMVETAAISDTPDWKEMINWGSLVADGHPLRTKYPHRYHDPIFPEQDLPGSAALLTEFHDTLGQLQRRFLRVIAEGIGAHHSYFDTMTEEGSHLTRAIRYPPMQDAPADGGHLWAEEHGDINLITALPRATARGLQVRTDSGWVDAVPPDGHVIINTGIMLEHLTNGMIPIGWHRVVAEEGQNDERISVVQFCHPTPWTILTPAVSTVTPERPQRFSAISASDRLDQVLWEIRLVGDEITD